jgi:hypothetical protein
LLDAAADGAEWAPEAASAATGTTLTITSPAMTDMRKRMAQVNPFNPKL